MPPYPGRGQRSEDDGSRVGFLLAPCVLRQGLSYCLCSWNSQDALLVSSLKPEVVAHTCNPSTRTARGVSQNTAAGRRDCAASNLRPFDEENP